MENVVLMDGGHETQLRKYVGSGFEDHPLWISRYLREAPEVCCQMYRDFIASGAKVIFTNTYQASVDNLQKHYQDLSREEALNLIKLAVSLCREAITLENAQAGVKVAGFIGPYGACLHDGSEYSGGNYVDKLTTSELVEWHRPRLETLIEAGCDFLVFGTMPSLKEVQALLHLLKENAPFQAIISFSAQDERAISHGELLSEAAQICWKSAPGQILAIGVNCLHPRLVEPLLLSIKAVNPEIPLFVRSNTVEIFNRQTKQWEEGDSDKSLPEFCKDSLRLGIRYIGGCCRTTVETIASFNKEIEIFKVNHNQMSNVIS